MTSISDQITGVDFFKRKTSKEGWNWDTGFFIGRPFKLSFNEASILTCDAWKQESSGIPQGCFLLAYYDCEESETHLQEAILLRVLEPTELPTDKDVISSMIEYYKDNIKTGSSKNSKLDEYSRYEFSFGGLQCRALGCFYLDQRTGKIRFGADIENFYSAHHYSVIKPNSDILKFIVNYRGGSAAGGEGDIKIGNVRYSSSTRFTQNQQEIPLYVKAKDFAGKRTALFGMTRTGKSNSIKKVIQANEDMSQLAPKILDISVESPQEILDAFISESPKYPIGQIIFDINGEYANKNLQDSGSAIFEIYKDKTERYSITEKTGFRVLKVNFFKEPTEGFELIKTHPIIADDQARFMTNFKSVNLDPPENKNPSEQNIYEKTLSIYLCNLYRAKFAPPANFKVKFTVDLKIREAINFTMDPSKGISLEEACNFWEKFWRTLKNENEISKKQKKTADGENNEEARLKPILDKYEDEKGYPWIRDDMKSLIIMLCRDGNNGYMNLRPLINQHTSADQDPFDEDILKSLRAGKIVIIDLSSGEEEIQRMYSERITKRIFRDSMQRFTKAQPNNFIQFYFEEAHNLFPKQGDKDLSQIYNRLAKEGAKLNLGLVYATQEVSSISGNILKATQNWFISHLNNYDEIRELKKYYDFSDFSESLVKFSQDTDKGFARVKTYSNSFVVPIQIDLFCPTQEG